MDHDQRFKTLFQQFLPLYAKLFYAHWLAVLDLGRVQWLEQEVFPDPPQGAKLIADLVARVSTLQPVAPMRAGEEEATSVLLHVEVEGEDHLTGLRPRLFDYHKHFRTRYHVPVLSVGLYLRVALHGRGTDAYQESFLGVESRMEWPYVGLPGLEAERYVQGDNVLGVALSVLMRIEPERRGWLAAEAMKRILESQEPQWRKYLLCECVQAYLPPEHRQAFVHLIEAEAYREVKTVTKTWFDEKKEEGRIQGMIQGKWELLVPQLRKKFGPLSPAVLHRLQTWPLERLQEVGEALLDAQSLEELGLGEENGQNGQNGQ